MQEAISQNDLVDDSLRAAMGIFKQASTIQYVNTHLARTAARDAKITLIEAYIQRQSGFPASEELSRAYKLPAGLFDVWGRLTGWLGASGHSEAQLQPLMSHLGI
ncbi:hypothetical protein E4U19_003087 [Claviceps sp. Clav32 group G5]|nr:hypothetical protein E4U19_003087 [Claviceps sp. Clav32 group G5]